MSRGKYIVLEGPEGVGKTTQILELARRLQVAGLPVRTLREPDSQSDLTARALRQLTQDPRYPMNTHTEVLLYNAARSQSLQVIKKSVEQGVICIVDRNYLTTLAIQYYGRGDLPDYETINRIITFAVNGVEPDLCVVLDAPVPVLKERAAQRGQGERFDNLDDTFLERVRSGYLWEAKQRNLPVVFANGDSEAVANDIWKLVAHTLAIREPSKVAASEPVSIKQVIDEKQQASPTTTPTDTATSFFIPEVLDATTRQYYEQTLNRILALQAELRQALTSSETDTISRLVLPVAAQSTAPFIPQPPTDMTLTELAQETSPETHAGLNTQAVSLADYWPRSELSLVPKIMYTQSNAGLQQLSAQIDQWSYEQKSTALRAYLQTESEDVLASVHYTWELVADYNTFRMLQAQPDIQLSAQRLTPRYGYEVPQAIEEARMTDVFEACFDASLELYSRMQAAGHTLEAQYATLGGHKLRFTAHLSLATLRRLAQATAGPGLSSILSALIAALSEVHPLIAEALQPASA